MKRQILEIHPGWATTGCCPGHDMYPDSTFSSNRSKRARSRDKAKEHRHARRVLNQNLKKEISNETRFS